MRYAKEDFKALVTTIESIYDLRGIGVSAVYVDRELWEYIINQFYSFNTNPNCADQCFSEVDPKVSTTHDGRRVIRITIKPYGADRIPVKLKYSGSNPWKAVVTYRKD